MADAVEEALLATLKAFAVAIPAFATWLASVIDGRDDRFSLRVADILPARSPAHDAVDTIRRRTGQ